jgi:hypothetical protein
VSRMEHITRMKMVGGGEERGGRDVDEIRGRDKGR